MREQLPQIKYAPNVLVTGSRRYCTLNSQLILVHFYFVLPQFQIKRARFSLVYPSYVQFCTKIVVFYFLESFQQPTFKLTSKSRPT